MAGAGDGRILTQVDFLLLLTLFRNQNILHSEAKFLTIIMFDESIASDVTSTNLSEVNRRCSFKSSVVHRFC